jgi:hypothetical protein
MNVALSVALVRCLHDQARRNCMKLLVARDGIEPPTRGFSVREHTCCSCFQPVSMRYDMLLFTQ